MPGSVERYRCAHPGQLDPFNPNQTKFIRPPKPATTLLLLLLASANVAFAQETHNTEAERRQAARGYLEVQPVEKMMRDVVEKMTARVTDERQAEMTQAMLDEVQYDTLRTAIIDAMTATFTVDEIEALTQFYSTPEGRSVMEKMSTYMARLQPVIMKEVRRAIQQVMRKQSGKE